MCTDKNSLNIWTKHTYSLKFLESNNVSSLSCKVGFNWIKNQNNNLCSITESFVYVAILHAQTLMIWCHLTWRTPRGWRMSGRRCRRTWLVCTRRPPGPACTRCRRTCAVTEIKWILSTHRTSEFLRKINQRLCVLSKLLVRVNPRSMQEIPDCASINLFPRP